VYALYMPRVYMDVWLAMHWYGAQSIYIYIYIYIYTERERERERERESLIGSQLYI